MPCNPKDRTVGNQEGTVTANKRGTQVYSGLFRCSNYHENEGPISESLNNNRDLSTESKAFL